MKSGNLTLLIPRLRLKRDINNITRIQQKSCPNSKIFSDALLLLTQVPAHFLYGLMDNQKENSIEEVKAEKSEAENKKVEAKTPANKVAKNVERNNQVKATKAKASSTTNRKSSNRGV